MLRTARRSVPTLGFEDRTQWSTGCVVTSGVVIPNSKNRLGTRTSPRLPRTAGSEKLYAQDLVAQKDCKLLLRLKQRRPGQDVLPFSGVCSLTSLFPDVDCPRRNADKCSTVIQCREQRGSPHWARAPVLSAVLRPCRAQPPRVWLLPSCRVLRCPFAVPRGWKLAA